MNVNL